MNQSESDGSLEMVEMRRLARAIRFALVAIVLGLSYFSVRSCLGIPAFGQMFADMLGGHPLPWLTQMVLGAAPVLSGVSLLVPLLTLGVLFLRDVVRSFYYLGVLGLVTLALFIVVYHGLTAVFFEIIRGMQSQ